MDNIVGYIGMFVAYLGGLDAIVFTGGIGENCELLREQVCERLSCFDVELDKTDHDDTEDIKLSSSSSRVSVWVVKANEEFILEKHVRSYLQQI